jgi:hypothetical protein
MAGCGAAVDPFHWPVDLFVVAFWERAGRTTVWFIETLGGEHEKQV